MRLRRNLFARLFFCFFILTFGVVSPALAEDLAQEVRAVRREVWSERYADAVAQKSGALEESKKFKTGVTFDDILKDPDNLELNFQFAQQQIANNELLGAAATLERILLVKPNLADVRLLYGVVLYRLNSLDEAKRELDSLQRLQLPRDIEAQVNEYRKRIDARKRRTRFGLRETIGWGYDTNRNAAPSSKFQLAGEVPVGLEGTNRKRDDTHFTNITTVDFRHDLGMPAGHEIFGSFTYFLQEQTKVDSLDIGMFQYELGGRYKSKWINVAPSFVASNILLSRETYLRTLGLNILMDRQITKKVSGFMNFRYDYQRYSGISENTTGAQRKGPEYDYLWGISYAPVSTMRIIPSIGYTNKNAKSRFDGYDRFNLNLTHTWALWRGTFLINTANLYFDRYDEPETAIAGRFRHDKIFRYRVTAGAPLSALGLGKVMPKMMRDIVFTLSYEYYRSLSNITNYAYTNNKIEGLFTKRWEF
ncbi:MAG: hypothetical protein BWY44_01157 [Candidatus Omnitrophica bacterium ADurb.Bin292]|nr:MAG: hypothetical protein BWY44_01157 [Candidatus Omnitrophica bacterium ADurb.Bin292]